MSKDEKEAEISAIQEIDKSLGNVCFGYNTEALIKKDGLYLVDVTNNPTNERIIGSFTVRYGYVEQDPKNTLCQIATIKSSKKDLLDLAIAYYRLGYNENPLRLECFFSCLTVLIRDISGQAHVYTNTLKNGIKKILAKNDSNFDITKFENEWKECYADERCSIAHGLGSKLINVGQPAEHDKIVNTVHFWTRAVIYKFINSKQQP